MNKKFLTLNGILLAVVAIAAFALGRFNGNSPVTADGIGNSAKRVSNYADSGSRNSGKEMESGESSSRHAGGGPAAMEISSIGPLAPEEVRQAVIEALNEPNPLKSNLLFAQLLEQLTLDNIEAAMEALRENGDGRTMSRQMSLFTYAYGALDGEKAIEYAQNLGGRDAVYTTSSALSGWASGNPQEAMDWLKSQEGLDGMEKAVFARSLVNGLAQTNLKLATEYAVSIGDRDMQRQMFDVIAREQFKNGIQSASAWINTLPDDAKTSALGNIAREAVRDDLDAAATWVTKYANEPYGARAIAEVADQLAETDPGRALDFVYGLPEGDAQLSGMAAAFREMTRSNFEQANALINEMPPSPLKDYALSSFIAEARRDDPQGALALAQTITDPALRERSTVEAIRPLYKVDPDTALQQAANLGLSVEAQEQLAQAPERGDKPRNKGKGRWPDGAKPSQNKTGSKR